jgi:hypothetical protein
LALVTGHKALVCIITAEFVPKQPLLRSGPTSNLPTMKIRMYAALFALAAAGLTGCVYTTVEVKPIHITVDVNVRVEKALDDFFGDIDSKSTTLQAQPTPQK